MEININIWITGTATVIIPITIGGFLLRDKLKTLLDALCTLGKDLLDMYIEAKFKDKDDKP